jgi:hypothetical protein
VVVGPPADASGQRVEFSDGQAWTDFLKATAEQGLGRREAVAALARRYGVPSRDVYAAIERARAADHAGEATPTRS